MAYKKILVDNLTCSRRFHISYDDEAPKVKRVEVACLHCGQVVFAADEHPPLRLLRDENRVSDTDLSELQTLECRFTDVCTPQLLDANELMK